MHISTHHSSDQHRQDLRESRRIQDANESVPKVDMTLHSVIGVPYVQNPSLARAKKTLSRDESAAVRGEGESEMDSRDIFQVPVSTLHEAGWNLRNSPVT